MIICHPNKVKQLSLFFGFLREVFFPFLVFKGDDFSFFFTLVSFNVQGICLYILPPFLLILSYILNSSKVFDKFKNFYYNNLRKRENMADWFFEEEDVEYKDSELKERKLSIYEPDKTWLDREWIQSTIEFVTNPIVIIATIIICSSAILILGGYNA